MAFTQQERERIVATIREKAPGGMGTCPICRNQSWQLAPDPVFIVSQVSPGTVIIGGGGYPCVMLICSRCGNSHILNMLVLGVGDLWRKETSPEASKEGA